MPYTYILRCSDNTLYSGWTTDVHKRLITHNKGKGGKYTRARLPVKLVYLEESSTRSEAQIRECNIKKLERSEKEKLIESNQWFESDVIR
ncbi:MAG: GIY-YIG nuclease family protein [Alkaliphilus sp.]|nr:GIY-YIG nuclease family protein [Alkaliphilus sp.]